VTSSIMSSNQVYFQINSKVARNLHAKFGMNGTVPEIFTIFSNSKHHPKRPWWRHKWCHRTKFTFKLMPWWQGTSTPSLAWIGQFLNFLRFFQAKTAIPCGRRDVIVGDVTLSLPAQQFQGGEEPPRQVRRWSDTFWISYDFFKQKPPSRAAAVTSSSMTSHRAYPQNDPGVARNLQAKFGADRTVSEFSTIFLKRNPRFYQVAVTSSSMTSHRAYPQNDSGVARNLQAKFGADRRSGWRVYPEQTHTPTFGFIDKIIILYV
jgi:hypothetical protein